MPVAADLSTPRWLEWLANLNERICIVSRNTAGALLAAMTAIVLLQVVFRYVLNDSLIWTEEVSKTMMVWAAFLVAPWAYRHGANVGIDLLAEALPAKARRLLGMLLNALVLWIVAAFGWESLGLVERGFSIRAASLELPVGWFFTVLPFVFGAMLLVGVELLLRELLGVIYPLADFSIADAGVPMEGE